MARKRGSRNKGFWFRSGRGWYVDSEPLRDVDGHHIKDRGAKEAAQTAYHLRAVGRGPEKPKEPLGYTVQDACIHYLKSLTKGATKVLRHRLLRDFCDGGPPSGTKVHKGYGDLPIAELIPLHVNEWLDAHEGWNGTRRIAVQALRRALRYSLPLFGIKENPLDGIKAGPAGKREACFSEEEESAIYQTASPALAELLGVMIRTGARPGEVARLEARHVEETAAGQLWRYPPGEHKTGHQTHKDRVIPVGPKVAALVRDKIKMHPTGTLFRNPRGTRWTASGMKCSFLRLRRKLEKKGTILAPGASMYAARATYAKRQIASGITVEKLAAKMGNSPAVCWAHYGEGWNRQKDNQPVLWEGLD